MKVFRRFFGSGGNGSMRTSSAIIDTCIVRVKGGDGGDGLVSYIKHSKSGLEGPGWPQGGSGGKGGSVHVRADSNTKCLKHVGAYIVGAKAQPGRKRKVSGLSGGDSYINVPIGTIVYDITNNTYYDDDPAEEGDSSCSDGDDTVTVLADLNKDGEIIKVVEGGKGGHGNTDDDPHNCTPGTKGTERILKCEMKMIADVGFVGFPNAGKSTLLGSISRACPKIAPYPFTTLAPHIGTVDFSDGYSLSVADLPGLVEDAHLNVGLGHEFLRHIERTRLLAYVLDAAHSKDLMKDFKTLYNEVLLYNETLAEKPALIVTNKCDLKTDETLTKINDFHTALKKFKSIPIIPISARHADGIPRLVKKMRASAENASTTASISTVRRQEKRKMKRQTMQLTPPVLKKVISTRDF